MSNPNYRNEKDEKDLRKREEKSAEEKQFDEKWRRDPLGAIVWACILIWAGLMLLADNIGLLDGVLGAFGAEPADFLGVSVWSFIFFGAGIILLGEVLIRTLIPEYSQPVTGTLIGALILIGMGLSSIFDWRIIWPLLLIGAGVAALLRGFRGSG